MRPDWLGEALAEDDAFRAEREYECKAAELSGLVYKTTEAPRPEPERSSVLDDPFFAEVMGHVINQLRDEFERDLRQIERDVRHVRAALTTEMITKVDERKILDELVRRVEGATTKGESSEVVDLPRDFWRKRRDDAA